MRGGTWMRAALLLALPLAACDKQGAWGEANSIIVASAPELWAEVGDTVQEALEPRIRTVRDERMFQVTWQDPDGEHWPNLRRFKQLLLVGSGEEPWISEAMAEMEGAPSRPGIIQVHDVWARGQLVTLVLLPGEGAGQAVHSVLPELRELFGRQYREWAVGRMFVSGRDSAGAETLRREAGFSLLLPRVYEWRSTDSFYAFRNDNPDPSELIREVVVAWRSPAPAVVEPETLLSWREELAATRYSYPQLMDLSSVDARTVDHGGRQVHQIQAVWQNPPEAEWPAGGPFILRAVPCAEQDRLYLIDAWLYAPGRQKYEFMIQLETILDSFECG